MSWLCRYWWWWWWCLPAMLFLLSTWTGHDFAGVKVGVVAFPLDANRLPGIWKLTATVLRYNDQNDIRAQLRGNLPPFNDEDPWVSPSPAVENENKEIQKDITDDDERSDSSNNNMDDILLKLNPDGTFRQCNEGYREGRWISGRWKLVMTTTSGQTMTTTRLLLAMNRQYYGPPYDILLDGCWENDKTGDGNSERSLCIQGLVQKGKYMHPPKHPAFFDTPMLAQPESIGPFTLKQSLATRTILGDKMISVPATDTTDDENNNDIVTSHFYGRTFIMTVEPLEESAAMKRQQEEKELRDRPVDIRSMEVQFFANNTFASEGTNKILRGRFSVTTIPTAASTGASDKDDANTKITELSMQVSLFGAGRSAPGSVYSEGPWLTHDDERTYIGQVQWQLGKKRSSGSARRRLRPLSVHGTAFFGTDLGDDARPEPVAKFTLTQDSSSQQVLIDDNKDDEDDTTNNFSFSGGVFE